MKTIKKLCGSKQHTLSELGKLLRESGWAMDDEQTELSSEMLFVSAKNG